MNGRLAMAIDGFRPLQRDAFVGFEPKVADRAYALVELLAHLLRVEVVGLENVPRGRALFVANHAFGWDVVFAMSAIRRATQRPVWVLGEHAWWKFPFLRRVAAAMGTVDGTPENADRLLGHDELVFVLPGGLREAVKPRELRYRLLWGRRYGFVRAAIRNRAPLVPVASIGADDLFDFVGNAYRRGEKLLRATGVPLPLPARILPIPHWVPLRFVIGEPIEPQVASSQPDDMKNERRLRREIEGALQELIDNELARRSGIEL